MVLILVKVLVGKGAEVFVGGVGVAPIPQNLAVIATRNARRIGALFLVNLWALNLQDLKKKPLCLHPQGPPSGQVTNVHRKFTLKVSFFCNLLILFRECVSTGAAGAQTRRSLGYHLLHPLILRLLVLCAPAVLRPRALQDAPAPADPNS